MLVVAICVLKEQTLKTEVNYNICLSVPFKAAVINVALLDQVMYNVTSLAHKNKWTGNFTNSVIALCSEI